MSIVGTVGRQMPAASDIDLVRASREGHDEAFEELYRRYHTRISHYVRGLVRDDGRAEDVCQEAFVAALRRIRRTDSEIQFKPWIYEIAHNKAIDAHRRAARTLEVSVDFEGELGAPAAVPPAGPHAPEACLMDKERFDNFRGALDELSESHHQIIVLRELEGLSYREIAARMQLSSAAVESALFRARRKLVHEYEQLDSGRRCRMVRASIARLAEGVDSGSDRRRLERHARRCWSCRRRAHELGVEPASGRRGLRSVGALLPLPGFLRRFFGGRPQGTGSAHTAREAMGALSGPGWEGAAQGAQKAAAVLASAVAIGGGGATLGGVGPLAVDNGGTASGGAEAAPAPRSERRAASSEGRSGVIERRGSDRSTPAARRARSGDRPHSHGASSRDDASGPARSGDSSPSTPGSSTSPTLPKIPPVDADRLLAPVSRGGGPAPPGGTTAPIGGGRTVPDVPALPALPADPKGTAEQVQQVGPQLPAEAPSPGNVLPKP